MMNVHFYFINTFVIAVFTLTLSDSFWFFNSSLELVSWIINSATFSALTSARGLDRGAFLRVFRVGINASSISSWLALGDKHSEKLLIQKSPFLMYYTTYNVTIASLMNLTAFKSQHIKLRGKLKFKKMYQKIKQGSHINSTEIQQQTGTRKTRKEIIDGVPSSKCVNRKERSQTMSEMCVIFCGWVVPDQDEMGQDFRRYHSPGQQKFGQAFTCYSSQLRALKSSKFLFNNIVNQ